MRLLLDTHAFIWWCQGDRKLGAKGRKSIAEASEVFVSAVTAWEIAIKTGLGKLDFPMTVDRAREIAGFSELPIRLVHADGYNNLRPHHTDPFDRLLVVQAQLEQLTIVTHDKSLAPYNVATLWI